MLRMYVLAILVVAIRALSLYVLVILAVAIRASCLSLSSALGTNEKAPIACRDSWQPVVKKKRRDLVPRYCAWSCFHSQQASNNAPMAAALIEEERFAQVMVACAIARQPLPRTSQGVARDTKRKVDCTYVCAVASFLPLLL